MTILRYMFRYRQIFESLRFDTLKTDY